MGNQLFKAAFVLLLSCSVWICPAQKIVRDHYTVSGGLLGAANFSKFRLTGESPGSEYTLETSWAAGLWINFPFANSFSLEPQVHYSTYEYLLDMTTPFLLNDGNIKYISVPLLFKFHLGRKFALTAGPQVDFFMDFDDRRSVAQEDDFKQTSYSVFGGLEICPHGRVTFFSRYVHGLTNMDNTDNPNTTIKYYNQNIQAGLKLKLWGKHVPGDSDGDGVPDPKDKCMMEVGFERYEGCPIPDTDKDNVNDEVDKCVTVPGVERYQGCPIPDTDKDAINDEIDKCPTVAGIAKYDGCPIPDGDGDGVNDEQDKCPTVAGLPKYEGCPIPDRDGDGINDEEDRCPDTVGVVEMKGCPKIEKFEAHQVTFASGKSILTKQGKDELQIVAAFMKRIPTAITVNLVGHTDSTGSDKINDPLSIARAESAKKYLVEQGIEESRIKVSGEGSKIPVAPNKTAKGRALNRRVEVTIE